MSTLRDRIVRQPSNMADHSDAHYRPLHEIGSYHPAPPHPMVMPLTIVTVTAGVHQVAQAAPLWAGPRGDTIPAAGPGQWVQIHAAGRP